MQCLDHPKCCLCCQCQVPYTLHIVTQLPQHKHLHEESNAKHYIEEKVAPELRNIGEIDESCVAWFQQKNKFPKCDREVSCW